MKLKIKVMKSKMIIRVFLFMALLLSHNSFGQETLGNRNVPVREMNSDKLNIPLMIYVSYTPSSEYFFTFSVKIRLIAYYMGPISHFAREYDMGSSDGDGDRSFGLIGDPRFADPVAGYIGDITLGDRIRYYLIQLCVTINGSTFYTPPIEVLEGFISYDFYDRIGGGIGGQIGNAQGLYSDISSVGGWRI